jgi:hypothetical protein
MRKFAPPHFVVAGFDTQRTAIFIRVVGNYLVLHILLSLVLYPPLRGGNARGNTLYIPHIPSEACPPIFAVDVEET